MHELRLWHLPKHYGLYGFFELRGMPRYKLHLKRFVLFITQVQFVPIISSWNLLVGGCVKLRRLCRGHGHHRFGLVCVCRLFCWTGKGWNPPDR